MSEHIITVEGLGKRYTISHEKRESYTALRDVISNKVKGLVKKEDSDFLEKEDFWALKDVNFEIKQGEAVGIIGRNGAGKSTLLKILSRITEPTHGRIELNGRVASLLEVGTGFHPELTGRENVFLNGAILGMSRAEIKRKFDEIVDFSGVEKFLDTPVKRYSSGMYVRLAFAVAAHLEPEILVVDEVLAVGDADFQKKCLGKMNDVTKNEGRTVLFVSHNTQALLALCSSGIWLKDGGVNSIGSISDLISSYSQDSRHNSLNWKLDAENLNSIYFDELNLVLDGEQPFIKLNINQKLKVNNRFNPAFVAYDILDGTGTQLMQALPQVEPFVIYKSGQKEVIIDTEIDLPALIPGKYFLSAWIGSNFSETIDWVKEVVGFEITDSPTRGRTIPHNINRGFCVPVSKININY